MSHTDGFDAYDTETVPPAVARYLSAQGDEEGRQSVVEAFTADARVTDEGIDYDGRDGIRASLDKTASRFSLDRDRISRLIIAP
jgi:hypothetical protein